jgi:hypothetical protein
MSLIKHKFDEVTFCCYFFVSVSLAFGILGSYMFMSLSLSLNQANVGSSSTLKSNSVMHYAMML